MRPKTEIISNLENKGIIYRSDLKRIQQMKDCSEWNSVTPLALIEYKTQFHHYDGGIVEFQGSPFYITTKQISALMKFVKWKFAKVAKVIDDKGKPK